MEPYDRTLPFGIVRTTSYTRLWNAVGGFSVILLVTSRTDLQYSVDAPRPRSRSRLSFFLLDEV
eukprot:scaffold33666_cov127-Skeletonema_dohrnii-CCMP3373.AAC.4